MRISIDGERWLFDGEVIHPGSPAEGLLTNVRMVNSVFEDDRADMPEILGAFDPDANTDRFIARIPDYVAHGIRAFTLSLQGGAPNYEGAVNSAFNADGSLRDGYLKRVARVIEAADANGCGIILSCFYQRQHSHSRALGDRSSIRAAVSNATDWVVAQGYVHVAMEIANEFAHGGYANWPEGEWLVTPEGQVELIEVAKDVAPELLVTTSGMGSGTTFDPVAEAGDFTIIHFNNTETDAIPSKIEASKAYGKPVVCNEDDKIGPVGAEAARLSILSGAGWGFMHSAKNQYAPFEFDGRDDDPEVYDTLSRLTQPGYDPGDISVSPVFALITGPKDGDTFVAGSTIAVRASVSGARSIDGLRIKIFANDVQIGVVADGQSRHRWEDVAPGHYDLVAVAEDGNGIERARSGPVDIVVK